MQETGRIVWIGRVLVGIVFFFNIQCALVFLIQPHRYVSGFELSGAVGAAMVQGIGLLFLMWNVPYAVALIHPVRNRVSLFEAVGMQSIGFIGEGLLAAGLPDGHAVLVNTVTRFMMFDGIGLLFLGLAGWLVWKQRIPLYRQTTY